MAEPASQGLGRTKHPESCNARNVSIAEVCLLISGLSFRKEFFSGRVGLGFALLLQLLIDAPMMSKGIDKLSIARPPEHVLQGHQNLSATRHRALKDGIGVISHERDPHA